MKGHLPHLKDLSGGEIASIIELAEHIKASPGAYARVAKATSMAMWFEKSSLRTRASFEAGMTQLGGHAMYLETSSTHSKKADLSDEIQCLARYVDIIIARVTSHETIRVMTEASTVPVVNALCDRFHPCQALADMMTLHELFKSYEGVTLCYTGDGNNVCNSLIRAAGKLGVTMRVATPADLKPEATPQHWTDDPYEAARDADIIYTDTWVSMGNEDEEATLVERLRPYQVDEALLGNTYFMHCLPAIRGKEVTDTVMDSKNSVVIEQAANRMHVQKALVLKLLGLA